VPADLSIVGIDGHEYADMFSLTTIEQQPKLQGEVAVGTLMEMLRDEPYPVALGIREFPTRLVVRSSTARPPHDAD
jgi:DNA-binding LacI/PurR family transcriptional regulator